MIPLLKVENLGYTGKSNQLFRSKHSFCLRPLSFELYQGQTLAIIGDNDSGKSLLAKLLVNAVKQDSGNIVLDSHSLTEQDTKQRCQNIRMIFQQSNESINPAITLGSTLEESLRLNTHLNKLDRIQKIELTLKQVGLLPEHRHFYRHMMSDGQLQRAAIARALILEPKILIADEPFAALDPSVRSQTVNLLLNLQKRLNLGYIFISHNLGIVRHISDHILVLHEGEVVESGATETVFAEPKSAFTKRLLQSYEKLIEE